MTWPANISLMHSQGVSIEWRIKLRSSRMSANLQIARLTSADHADTPIYQKL